MGKNMVSTTKATISFIIWELLFEIIFFMIIGFLSGILIMAINNEVTANIIMIIPKVLAQFLVVKFAIWNTFKKQTIESSDENETRGRAFCLTVGAPFGRPKNIFIVHNKITI